MTTSCLFVKELTDRALAILNGEDERFSYDPDAAIAILKAADLLCEEPNTCRQMQKAIDQVDCGTQGEAANILEFNL